MKAVPIVLLTLSLALGGCASDEPAANEPLTVEQQPPPAVEPSTADEPTPLPTPAGPATVGQEVTLTLGDGSSYQVRVGKPVANLLDHEEDTKYLMVPVSVTPISVTTLFGEAATSADLSPTSFQVVTDDPESTFSGGLGIASDGFISSLEGHGFSDDKLFATDAFGSSDGVEVPIGTEAKGVVPLPYRGKPQAVVFSPGGTDAEATDQQVFRLSGAAPKAQAVGTGPVLARLSGAKSKLLPTPKGLPQGTTVCYDFTGDGNNVLYNQTSDSGEGAELLVNVVGSVKDCQPGIFVRKYFQVLASGPWTITLRRY
jgi:hypothetical protein